MAGLATPLTDMMGKTATRLGFKWGEEQERALEALKAAVLLAPAKVAPDYSLPFHIFVDASDVGVACVLVQFRTTPEGDMKPFAIHHHSRRWSAREARWSVSERELYGIRYGLFKSKQWIQGHPDVTVWTDHLNLVTGLWTHCSPKIERWRLFIESFQPFKLRHVRGTSELQTVADSLSRLHVDNLRLPLTVDDEDPECVFWADRAEGELKGEHELFGEDAPKSSVAAAVHAILNNTHATEKRAREQITIYSEQYGKGADLFAKQGGTDTGRAPIIPKPWIRREGVGYNKKAATAQTSQAESATQQNVTVDTATICNFFNLNTHPHPDNPLYIREITAPPGSHLAQPGGGWSQRKKRTEGKRDTAVTTAALVGKATESECAATNAPETPYAAIANPTVSTNTCTEDLRKAALKAKGGFPSRELLRLCHDHTHPCFTITWKRMVQATGVAPGRDEAQLREETKRYCDTCLVCQKLKPAKERVSAKLGQIRSRPFAQLAFDIIVLAGSEDGEGHRYILVVVDSFTHAVELFPLKKATADAVSCRVRFRV
jgi:hypothetical protein